MFPQNEELKSELNAIHENYGKELKKAVSDHEAEKKSYNMRRDNTNDEQRYYDEWNISHLDVVKSTSKCEIFVWNT